MSTASIRINVLGAFAVVFGILASFTIRREVA